MPNKKKDPSFVAAEKAKSFTDKKMLKYLSKDNKASNERKVHCFMGFLEERILQNTFESYTFLNNINPKDLDLEVAEGIKYFISCIPYRWYIMRDRAVLNLFDYIEGNKNEL